MLTTAGKTETHTGDQRSQRWPRLLAARNPPFGAPSLFDVDNGFALTAEDVEGIGIAAGTEMRSRSARSGGKVVRRRSLRGRVEGLRDSGGRPSVGGRRSGLWWWLEILIEMVRGRRVVFVGASGTVRIIGELPVRSLRKRQLQLVQGTTHAICSFDETGR